MPDVSARLALPYLLPAQAQKHVTHNEALERLDTLVQLVLEAVGAETPPALPEAGQVWALGAAPTADWAGEAGKLARFTGEGWLFVTPAEGWIALERSAARVLRFDGSDWVSPAAPDLSGVPGIGIGTGWDPVNRLSVVSGATLLTHDGAGHQVKVNKAGAGDTASLLFQTNWSGRAEMGTAGTDDFAIKVSADGSGWVTALSFDAGSGIASGAAVQQAADDVTPGRLARADYAYGPGNLLGAVSESAGVPTGAVIEQGSNANGRYVRFADGTQICWVTGVDMGSILADGSGTWASPYRTAPINLTWPAAFSGAPAVSVSMAPDTATVPLDDRALVANVYDAPQSTGWLYLRVARMGGGAYDVDILLSVVAVGRWF